MYELIKNRRSIRKYSTQQIEEEKLSVILKSALMAPSSKSRRPWEFVVVKEAKQLEYLAKSRSVGGSFLKDAPLAIIVIADPNSCDVWIEDTAIASTYIQLSAQALGLRTCWIQGRLRMASDEVSTTDYINEYFGIPAHYEVASIISIGYPNEEKAGHLEDALKYHKLHIGKFGNPFRMN